MPHILLISDLEKEAENDPQLQKVVEFKNGIDRDHLLLYGEFETPSEFKAMLEKQMKLWIRDNARSVEMSVDAPGEPKVVVQQAVGEVARQVNGEAAQQTNGEVAQQTDGEVAQQTDG